MRISHCIVLLDTDIQTQEVDGEIFWYDALARQYKVRVILKQIFFSLFSSLSSSPSFFLSRLYEKSPFFQNFNQI